MNALISLHNSVFSRLESLAPALLPTLARLVFAAVLLRYFLNSAFTKLDGLFTPTLNAYAQIFPRAMEAAGYDPSQLSAFPSLVVILGAYAEILLPLLIILGLFTRLAALGMIGFVIVQTATDLIGHGAAFGAWFNVNSAEVIADQRAFWVLLLVLLALRGAGPLSLDAILGRNRD
jgi:putative oxidoreductase